MNTRPMTYKTMKRMRRQAGLTQRALALQLGLTANHVARLERGDRPITLPIAKLLRLTLGGRR